ncbi:VENN motif pre-toxin domain-containing protein, partial [Caviibacterium pharyngocola]
DIDKIKEQQETAQVIGEISQNTVTLTLKPLTDNAENAKAQAQAVLNSQNATVEERLLATQALAQAQTTLDQYGKGGDIQLAMRAVTGVLQGLAMKDINAAITAGLSPYANNLIKTQTGDNTTANLMAHAVLGAIEAQLTGNNALAGATAAVTGEVAADYITKTFYNKTTEQLSENEKQTVTALSQMASGLAGGLIGDSTANALAGSEIGKRAVENNYLSFDIMANPNQAQELAMKAEGEVIKNNLKTQAIETVKEDYPLIYKTLEGSYYVLSNTGKAIYVGREITLAAAPLLIAPEITFGTKVYTFLSNSALSGSANLIAQTVSGQEFNWAEFAGATVSGGITPKLKTMDAIRVNAGIGMAVGLANGTSGLSEAGLSGIASYGSSKISNPMWSTIASEAIQKLPTIRSAISSEKKE